MSEEIELVCFDVGGVLVRICHTWTDACRNARIDVRGEPSEHADAARRELTNLYGLGRISETEWAERLALALGNLYTPEELINIHDAIILSDEYPGVGAVIDDVHRAGIATACLSNTDHGHWVRVVHRDGDHALAGDPRYPALLRLGSHHASHLMGVAKPDQAIYRAFERATGYAGPQILFFDDHLDNVEAARSVGWLAERIDAEGETAMQLRRHLQKHGVLR
jgi:glucose-1-phosphatase